MPSTNDTLSTPEHLSTELSYMLERWFMSSSTLSDTVSSMIMRNLILPAMSQNIKQHEIGEYSSTGNTFTFSFDEKELTKGNQVLKAVRNAPTSKYQINFPPNGVDAISPLYVREILQQFPDTNHIFWNYPDVLHTPPEHEVGDDATDDAEKQAAADEKRNKHVNPLFEAGYQYVKAQLESEDFTRAEDTTLYGLSLGGGVAAHVARRLHEDSQPFHVNLIADRTFSNLSDIPSAYIDFYVDKFTLLLSAGGTNLYDLAVPLVQTLSENILGDDNRFSEATAKKVINWAAALLTLLTSILVAELTAASIGLVIAGLMASVGVLIASLIANIGYYFSVMLSAIPGIRFFAPYVNALFNFIAETIHLGFDLVASLSGLAVISALSIPAFVIGLIIGGCLLLPSLFASNENTATAESNPENAQSDEENPPQNTEEPSEETPRAPNIDLQQITRVPLGPAIRMACTATTGEIHTASNVRRILNRKNHGNVTIINSKADFVIPPGAALNTGLGFTANKAVDATQFLMEKLVVLFICDPNAIATISEQLSRRQYQPAAESFGFTDIEAATTAFQSDNFNFSAVPAHLASGDLERAVTALGFENTMACAKAFGLEVPEDENEASKHKDALPKFGDNRYVRSIWHNFASHTGTLQDDDIDRDLTHDTIAENYLPNGARK